VVELSHVKIKKKKLQESESLYSHDQKIIMHLVEIKDQVSKR